MCLQYRTAEVKAGHYKLSKIIENDTFSFHKDDREIERGQSFKLA